MGPWRPGQRVYIIRYDRVIEGVILNAPAANGVFVKFSSGTKFQLVPEKKLCASLEEAWDRRKASRAKEARRRDVVVPVSQGRRQTHCWQCHRPLDSEIDPVHICGWLRCRKCHACSRECWEAEKKAKA